MKTVTHHRALSYLLQGRIISTYAKLMKKDYKNADEITGKTYWCDFYCPGEWGEVILIFQKSQEVPSLFQKLFTIDIPACEKEYQISIDENTHPESSQSLYQFPTIEVDTHHAILSGLEKKLSKRHPYSNYGYHKKGILILAIFDPSFSNFTNDLEIRYNKLNLNDLKIYAQKRASESSFDKVLLVDGLVDFSVAPKSSTFELCHSHSKL